MTLLGERWRRLLTQPVAELAIIIAGVTIALWADGWMSDRAALAEETARLQALMENVDETLERLDTDLAIAEGSEQALRSLSSDSFAGLPRNEQYRMLRYGMLFGPDFAPELVVYDELESSGQLGLLSNAKLRWQLAELNANFNRVRLSQDDLSTVQQLNVDTYLLRNIDMRPFYGEILDLEVSEEQSEQNLSFVETREFQNIVLLKLDILTFIIDSVADTKESLLAIRLTLTEQLDDRFADSH